MSRYLAALALTLIVEAVVLAACSRGSARGRLVRTSLFVNLLTHPLANLLLTGGTLSFVVVESGVIVAETLLYADLERCGARRALLWSLIANGATMALSPWFG